MSARSKKVASRPRRSRDLRADLGEVETTKWPPDPGADGINEWPPEPGGVGISKWPLDSGAAGTSKWPLDPGADGTSEWPPDPGAVGTSEWPRDLGAVGTFERVPDPGGYLGALEACVVASMFASRPACVKGICMPLTLTRKKKEVE
jgi:hypothetical protein